MRTPIFFMIWSYISLTEADRLYFFNRETQVKNVKLSTSQE